MAVFWMWGLIMKRRIAVFIICMTLFAGGCTAKGGSEAEVPKETSAVSEENIIDTGSGKTDAEMFSEEAEAFAREILEKEKQEFNGKEQGYEIDVEIYDKKVLHAPSGELYFFRISTEHLGQGDNAYIIKSDESGMQILFSEPMWARSYYNIYDGVYMQSCRSGGAVTYEESLFSADTDIEPIYSYKTDMLLGAWKSDWEEDFSLMKPLIAAFEEAGIPDAFLEDSFAEMFSVGDNRAWKLSFREEETYKTIVAEVIDSFDFPDSTAVFLDQESFEKKCSGMLADKGVDLSAIYSNEPIIGEKVSLVWKKIVK